MIDALQSAHSLITAPADPFAQFITVGILLTCWLGCVVWACLNARKG